jgi:hypothetical protein
MRFLVLMCFALATPAAADEISPWFGSSDQLPFQMASDGRPVILHTSKTGDHAEVRQKTGCAIRGCSVADSTANVPGTGLVSP